MKKTNIILALFITLLSQAQTPVYTLGYSPINKPDGCYIKDNNNILDKFVGTWTLNQNGELFSITLIKAEMVHLINYFNDELQGSFVYTVNNSNIVNTVNFTGAQSKLSGVMVSRLNPNIITIFFEDPARPKMGCFVTLTHSAFRGGQKLHWNLYLTGIQPRLPGESAPLLNFRVPTNCELIKQ